jgi:hypothetical protein
MKDVHFPTKRKRKLTSIISFHSSIYQMLFPKASTIGPYPAIKKYAIYN